MTSTPPRPWRTEFAATLKLAWPLVATNLAQALVGATDVAMLGRLGSDTLAAATLGLNLAICAPQSTISILPRQGEVAGISLTEGEEWTTSVACPPVRRLPYQEEDRRE